MMPMKVILDCKRMIYHFKGGKDENENNTGYR